MKKHLLTLALMAATALGAFTVHADTSNAMATAAAATTNAPAATTNAPVAAWTTNAPTVEQRPASVEA